MAKRTVIISERDNLAALLEGDKAIEFIINRGDMLLGDVFLAEVENILPSIDAAFVSVGSDKMGFLHSSDVQGKGDLKLRLKPKQKLVVQVMKEPTGHKGPRVTTDISLPGRFLVLMPESKGISISRKVESAAERARLKSAVSLIKPAGVGVIIRTEAEGQSEQDIQEDFEGLLERWQNIVAMADTTKAPALLARDQDLLYRVIREAVNEDVDELVVDTSFGFQRAQQLLQTWNLDKNINVTQYTGNVSILVAKGVEKEIRQALQTKVPLPSGGYLYIQPTEALCVVDVNSGRFTSLQSQADTIRITNLEATKEIARQLRLRNIGGMIVVDFIDMESRADQLSVLQAFELELAPDKSKPQVGQLTDLGLVEMTRHRQGQALSEIFGKHCHHCHSAGHLVEEFHWAVPGQDVDPRSSGDFRGFKGKGGRVPSFNKSSAAPAISFKPAGEKTTEGDKPANGSSSERHGERNGEKGDRNRDRGDRSDKRGGRFDRNDRPGDRTRPNQPVALKPGQALLKAPSALLSLSPGNADVLAVAEQADALATEVSLDEYYRHQLMAVLGLKFADGVKVSMTPRSANSALSRLNGRSTDIFTLVASLEDGGTLEDRKSVV